MNQINDVRVSLSRVIRERRGVLHLTQADVAAGLNIEPESVCLWENDRRRMELDKLPRLAMILKLNPADLCRLGLFQWHPSVYGALFGPEPPQPPQDLNQSTQATVHSAPPAVALPVVAARLNAA
jgi:transcriptional regulator with XRE-family HTH domain